MLIVNLPNILVAPQIGLYTEQNNLSPTYTSQYACARMFLSSYTIQTDYWINYKMEKCHRYTMASVNILLGCVSPVLQIIVGNFMVIFLSPSY